MRVRLRRSAGNEILAVGLYVDNLTIVHSAPPNGDPVDPNSFYATLIDRLQRDWEVEDEGRLDDMLGVEIDRHDDGSITLHQTKYVGKLLQRFMPEPPSGLDSRKVLPHSSALPKIVDAICNDPNRDPANPSHPELVKPTQEKCGSL